MSLSQHANVLVHTIPVRISANIVTQLWLKDTVVTNNFYMNFTPLLTCISLQPLLHYSRNLLIWRSRSQIRHTFLCVYHSLIAFKQKFLTKKWCKFFIWTSRFFPIILNMHGLGIILLITNHQLVLIMYYMYYNTCTYCTIYIFAWIITLSTSHFTIKGFNCQKIWFGWMYPSF